MRKSWLYLADAIAAAEAAGLDLAGVGGDREVRDERVFGLAGAMRDDRGVARGAGQADRVERLGQGTDLVQLDQDRVGDLLFDAAREALLVGYEQIVTDQLDFAAKLVGQQLPSRPSRLRRSRLRC